MSVAIPAHGGTVHKRQRAALLRRGRHQGREGSGCDRSGSEEVFQPLANLPAASGTLSINQRPSGCTRLGTLWSTLDQVLQLERSAWQLGDGVTALVHTSVVHGGDAVGHVGGPGHGSGSCSSSGRQLGTGAVGRGRVQEIWYMTQAEILHDRLGTHFPGNAAPLGGQMRSGLVG